MNMRVSSRGSRQCTQTHESRDHKRLHIGGRGRRSYKAREDSHGPQNSNLATVYYGLTIMYSTPSAGALGLT